MYKSSRIFVFKALVASMAAWSAWAELPVCNYDEDIQVEFSECDPYGTSRNGKSITLFVEWLETYL